MLYTPMIIKAIRIMFDAHKEQTDKSGVPYVFHPFHLAEQMQDEKTTIAALLHDTIEDTDITAEYLLAQGFDKDIVAAVVLLTHNDDESYLDYVRRVKADPIARAVKLADLKHNSDLSRLEKVTPKDIERCEKYKKAINILKSED